MLRWLATWALVWLLLMALVAAWGPNGLEWIFDGHAHYLKLRTHS